jgi:hypothetical protein
VDGRPGRDGDVGRAEVGSVGANAMYDMQSLRGDDSVFGTLVLGLITGRDDDDG